MRGIKKILNETVIIRKPNGYEIKCEKAHIGKYKAYIFCENINLEENDTIIRKIDENHHQEFNVTNRGYYDDKHFGKHYQADIEPKIPKTSSDLKTQQNIKIEGNNNKIYIDSSDNSTTNLIEIPYDKLYNEINKINNEETKNNAINCLNEIKNTKDETSLKKKYHELLGIVSDYASIVSAIITIMGPFL